MTQGRAPDSRPDSKHRWLGFAAAGVLALAALVAVLAWRESDQERRESRDVKAHVASEMNRIEAEAARMEREAGN